MDLTPYLDGLRQELLASTEVPDEATKALVERLLTSYAAATRLTILEVLAGAADEITRDLVPGSVEVRLRGRNPGFAVTPPTLPDSPDDDPAPDEPPPPPITTTQGAVGRINFRPPEHLKARIEAAAEKEGASVNAWLVHVVTTALDGGAAPSRRRRGDSGPTRHNLGWFG